MRLTTVMAYASMTYTNSFVVASNSPSEYLRSINRTVVGLNLA